jgi:hypothetical protein
MEISSKALKGQKRGIYISETPKKIICIESL